MKKIVKFEFSIYAYDVSAYNSSATSGVP